MSAKVGPFDVALSLKVYCETLVLVMHAGFRRFKIYIQLWFDDNALVKLSDNSKLPHVS